MRAIGLDVQAVNDLTTESCRRFNEEIGEPSVPCFSVSAARPWHRVPPFAIHSFKIINDAEGENDGLVSVKSSTWATHLGVWPADHWHTINHRMVVEWKEPTGDITPYYLDALDRMEAEGVDMGMQQTASAVEPSSALPRRLPLGAFSADVPAPEPV